MESLGFGKRINRTSNYEEETSLKKWHLGSWKKFSNDFFLWIRNKRRICDIGNGGIGKKTGFLERDHYPEKHENPRAQHLRQNVIHDVDVLREAIHNASRWSCVKQLHRPAKHVRQQNDMHLLRGIQTPKGQEQRCSQIAQGYARNATKIKRFV